MDFLSKIKLLHKNYGLGYWVFLIMLFSYSYLSQDYRDDSLDVEIRKNLGLTSGKVIKKSTTGYGCQYIYVYSTHGNYYIGDSGCFKGLEICNNYVVAYSKKDPKKSVLLPNYPLTNNNYVGEIINDNEYKITEEMLLKWVKSKNLYSSRADKVYTLKEYKEMNLCNDNISKKLINEK